MKEINKAIFEYEGIDHTLCEECLEDYLFKFKDSYHEFYIPLNDILTCLWLADKEGVIPPIRKSWYNRVHKQYSL